MIIERVEDIADKKECFMMKFSLLVDDQLLHQWWCYEKHHIDGAVKAADIILSDEEFSIRRIYKPYPLEGMSSNKQTFVQWFNFKSLNER